MTMQPFSPPGVAGSADLVHDHRVGHDDASQAGAAGAHAELGVLAVQEVVLVHAAESFPVGAGAPAGGIR